MTPASDSGAAPRRAPPVLENPLKARIREGTPIFGIMATMPSVGLVQLLARSGFDYVKIDLEHSPIDVPSAHAMIAATQGTGCVPVARVPENLPWLVKPLLDAGALGICFPMVRTAAEATSAARSMRYHPEGDRGWGPFYAHARWGLSMVEYVEQVNDQVTTELLIEHADAVDNLEEILEVSGVDTAFIAPQDLAVSLGHRGHPEHAKVQEYVRRAEEIILRSKRALGGVSVSPERTQQMLDRGYRVLTLGFDWLLLQRGAEQMLRVKR